MEAIKTSWEDKGKDYGKRQPNFYQVFSGWIGGLVGLIVFVVGMFYAVHTYGWFLGLGICWIPSGVFALVAAFLAEVFWPVIILLAIAVSWYSIL